MKARSDRKFEFDLAAFVEGTSAYLLAVLVVVVAFWLKINLDPYADQEKTPFLFFFGAVIASALFGGFGPGLAAVVMTLLIADYCFIEPRYEWKLFRNDSDWRTRESMYLVESAVICVIAGSLRRAIKSARASNVLAEREFRAREASDARFRRLVDSNIIAVFSSDSSGTITDANDAFLDLLQMSAGEIEERRVVWPDLVPPEEREALTAILGELDRVHRSNAHELALCRRDGSRVTVLLGAARVDAVQGQLVCFALDQSEQRAVAEKLAAAKEAAESANHAKSAFLANLSHELRTPMNSTLGMIELAMENAIAPAVKEYLNTAKVSADTLMRLLNDLLDLSRIEAGKLEIIAAPFAIHPFLDDVARVFAFRAHERELDLVCEVGAGVPDWVIGDSLRLRQVLLNLLANAIKFTSEGEIVLGVFVAERTDRLVTLRFQVSDTGIGISDTDLVRIFRPFTQVDSSSTRRFGGAGLGLAIVRELVQLMGGKLDVNSAAGSGSTFTATIQFDLLTDERRRDAFAIDAERPAATGLRVLVADDHRRTRRVIIEQLSEWGFRPTKAFDWDDAYTNLTRAAEGGAPFDLAIIDACMPARHGLALLRKLRAHPNAAQRVVLMLCSPDFDSVALQEPISGVGAVLHKPVTPLALARALRSSLGCTTEQMPRAPKSRRRLTGENGRSIRVLLAEDTPANSKLVVSILEARGCSVDVATNGAAALEMWTETTYDVIIMDLQMPLLDGYETTRRIRDAERNSGGRTPIIAMTAHAMPEDRDRCLSEGMDDYISKPIDISDLVAKIETRLSPNHEDGRTHNMPTRPAGEPTTSPAFDVSTTLKRLANDESLLRDMATYFRRDHPALFLRLRQSIQSADAPSAHRAAHSMLGLVSTFEAAPAIESITAIERMTRRGALAGAGELLVRLESELHELDSALRELAEHEAIDR
jgi:PAS domain S-box-containing protein